MSKYRILYIDDWGDWGGAEKVVMTLIESLDRERYEPHFILGFNGAFAQALAAEGIPVQIIPMTPMVSLQSKYMFPLFVIQNFWKIILCTARIYPVIQRIRPDIIHTCSIQAKIAGSFAAALTGTKILWHVHNIQPPGFRRKLVQFLARWFPNIIVTVSQAVANCYRGVVQADKICVNHNGLDLRELIGIDRRSARSMVEAELGITSNVKIVANVSMIRRWKGQHLFVEAASEVLKICPDVVFLLVGEAQFSKDHGYKAQLINLIGALSLTDKVRFLGFREDVYRIVAAADCLVHCPIEPDPLPTAVLEAMALRTPVIGTSVGGIPEEIEDGVTGLLVKPGDPIELAKAIEYVLTDINRTNMFVQAALHKLQTEFSKESFISKFDAIYAQLTHKT